MANGVPISGKQFAQYLASNVPRYDDEVAKDIRPTDGSLINYYRTKAYDAYSGVQHTFNRFRTVFPDLTQAWYAAGKEAGNVQVECNGTPCDLPQNSISWGFDRFTYGLEFQQWSSQIFCFDSMLTATEAKQQMSYIISDVLKAATKYVVGNYVMKRAILNGYSNRGGQYFVTANGLQQGAVSYQSGQYVYMNTTLSGGGAADPAGILTPEILQRFAPTLFNDGAIKHGEEYFDQLELHTDIDTLYKMRQGNPTITDRIRYNSEDFPVSAPEFYKYGWKGTIGDYMVKCLDHPDRYNKVAPGVYQWVPPFKNGAATVGQGSVPSQDWNNAQYQWSLVNNRRGMILQPFLPSPVSPEMPLTIRNYAGNWRFVMNDLGADANGVPIDNSRGNKGKFIADFGFAFQPIQPEWVIPIFHKREPQYALVINTCAADPGYPTQNYSSTPVPCQYVSLFTASPNASGTGGPVGQYLIPASSVVVNGNIAPNTAISGATVAALITSLNANAVTSALGVWALYSDGVQIQLTEPTGQSNSIILRFQL